METLLQKQNFSEFFFIRFPILTFVHIRGDLCVIDNVVLIQKNLFA